LLQPKSKAILVLIFKCSNSNPTSKHVSSGESSINLWCQVKRDRLVIEFRKRGLDYVGSSDNDLPFCSASLRAYVVSPYPGVEAKAILLGNMERVITSPYFDTKSLAKGLHFHQLMKITLIFLAVLESLTWLLNHRSQMQNDPVVFNIKDRLSWLLAWLPGTLLWFAI
jgi:hypothetical protein